MTAPFNSSAVSSLAEVIAAQSGGLTFVPQAHLRLWLPDLTVPPGWAAGSINDPAVTRVLVRRLGSGHHWDGCEVLNVYRVPGTVPETIVLNNADRTLRDSGANDIRTYRLDVPPCYGVIAMRSSGTLHADARTIHSHFHHYVINTAAGGALIEQVVAVGAEALPRLNREVEDLIEILYRSLLTSIERAPKSPTF
ncbi:hypothetical protein [Mycobacterium sp.]|uniref:hypothetical protein n=1 Tax=Mycobacterium sp. TaxID=1785 RepID=UPI003D6C3E09